MDKRCKTCKYLYNSPNKMVLQDRCTYRDFFVGSPDPSNKGKACHCWTQKDTGK